MLPVGYTASGGEKICTSQPRSFALSGDPRKKIPAFTWFCVRTATCSSQSSYSPGAYRIPWPSVPTMAPSRTNHVPPSRNRHSSIDSYRSHRTRPGNSSIAIARTSNGWPNFAKRINPVGCPSTVVSCSDSPSITTRSRSPSSVTSALCHCPKPGGSSFRGAVRPATAPVTFAVSLP